MQKALPLVMLLLVSTFSFVSSSGVLGNIEKRIIDLLEGSYHTLDVKASNAKIIVVALPEKIIALSYAAADFVSDFFNLGIKFINNALSFSVQFLLFTPAQPLEAYDLQLSEGSIQNSTFNSSLGTKFLIHGYTSELPFTSVYFEIKDSLLNHGDYNVIVVNWTSCNKFPYTFASIKSVFVGCEIGKLIELLADSANITSKSVHLIGHSLGAHAAGFAGKVVNNIGRITGLDAAGPIFQYLPKFLRLSEGDADFVDAIHSNGVPTLFEGHGTIRRYGNMDFFPNGGSLQPNCSSGDTYLDTDKNIHKIKQPMDEVLCSHSRAPFLFLYSIKSCRFESVPCSNYTDFENGNCSPDNSAVVRMGLEATPFTSNSNYATFYLDTTGVPPYCATPS